MAQGRITGTDISIEQQPSAGREFLSGLGKSIAKGIDEAPEERKRKNKEQVEKIELYNTLRDSGFSQEEAAEKVDKAFKGTFLENILSKRKGFEPPSGADKQARKEATAELKAKKTQAGITKTRAETQKILREEERAAQGKKVFTVNQQGQLVEKGTIGAEDKVIEIQDKSQISTGDLVNIINKKKAKKELRRAAEAEFARRMGEALGVAPEEILKKPGVLEKMIAAFKQAGFGAIGESIAEGVTGKKASDQVTSQDELEGRTKMRKPDGKLVAVKNEQVNAAKQKGYKVV